MAPETVKKKLLLISDIHGVAEPTGWVSRYTAHFAATYQIEYLSSLDLAEVDLNHPEKTIHEQFTAGGIDKAAHKLAGYTSEPVYAIGLSIGGTILWKAAQLGLQAKAIACISSTRLRYETEAIRTPAILFFGADDAYKPGQEWCEAMQVPCTILKKEGHEFYRQPESLDAVFAEIDSFFLKQP